MVNSDGVIVVCIINIRTLQIRLWPQVCLHTILYYTVQIGLNYNGPKMSETRNYFSDGIIYNDRYSIIVNEYIHNSYGRNYC